MPAWGAGMALASALVAALELAPVANGCGFACTFPVLDAVSPQAKLAFGALLGSLMWLARRRRPSAFATLAIRDAAAGALAAALVLALLPEGWSRGFGIGLFDVRFAPLPTALYLASAAAGGMLGTLLERSCRRRLSAQ